MKEFKKWWDNQFSSRKGNDNSHLGYPEAHQSWKAALKWAKAMHSVSSEPRFNLNITKELENE